ncbi:restriction endonuclease subunit S, partial [Brachybacterium sp. UMB0905]|uniref:restriction endonuclease subunit S n=1 Tax=Brachybacterium sp. UMB0905 TaxID=2069310 RepID=UPI0035109655
RAIRTLHRSDPRRPGVLLRRYDTTYREQLEIEVSGAIGLARNISLASLRSLPIPALNTRQQAEFVGEAVEARQNVEAAQADITAAITLAKERRAALITAAVTGQIDVTHKQRPVVEQLQDDLQEQA